MDHVQQRSVILIDEHYHLPARLSAAVHQPQHTDIIGVEAQSYILYVNHQHVEVMHDGIARPRAASVVERAYGDACGLVHRTAHVLAGIGRATEPVLRRENHSHVDTVLQHQVEGVFLTHHARVV